MKQGYCLVSLEMALGQLLEAPEMICMDDDNTFDATQSWYDRSRSISNSLVARGSKMASKTKNRFSLAVPDNILAPSI